MGEGLFWGTHFLYLNLTNKILLQFTFQQSVARSSVKSGTAGRCRTNGLIAGTPMSASSSTTLAAMETTIYSRTRGSAKRPAKIKS